MPGTVCFGCPLNYDTGVRSCATNAGGEPTQQKSRDRVDVYIYTGKSLSCSARSSFDVDFRIPVEEERAAHHHPQHQHPYPQDGRVVLPRSSCLAPTSSTNLQTIGRNSHWHGQKRHTTRREHSNGDLLYGRHYLPCPSRGTARPTGKIFTEQSATATRRIYAMLGGSKVKNPLLNAKFLISRIDGNK